MLPDPVDRLVLDVAREQLAGRRFGRCVVVDDRSGGLVTTCRDDASTTDVRWACDSLLDERAVSAAVGHLAPGDLADPATFAEAELVLFRLPRVVDAVRVLAERIAAVADPDVLVVGGARVKHMAYAMTSALGSAFAEVQASLGRQKSRALIARTPRPGVVVSPPRSRPDRMLGFPVVAEAGVFGGTRLDGGSALLLDALRRHAPAPGPAVADLGCGNGVLATWWAVRHRRAEVLAVDISAAACRSAAATSADAGVADRVAVRRSAGLEVTPGEMDLVLCNPPFHRDGGKDSELAEEMIRSAAAALRPGGELWLVFNSHLPYREILRAMVGSTEVVAQNPGYMVTRTVRREP